MELKIYYQLDIYLHLLDNYVMDYIHMLDIPTIVENLDIH